MFPFVVELPNPTEILCSTKKLVVGAKKGVAREQGLFVVSPSVSISPVPSPSQTRRPRLANRASASISVGDVGNQAPMSSRASFVQSAQRLPHEESPYHLSVLERAASDRSWLRNLASRTRSPKKIRITLSRRLEYFVTEVALNTNQLGAREGDAPTADHQAPCKFSGCSLSYTHTSKLHKREDTRGQRRWPLGHSSQKPCQRQ